MRAWVAGEGDFFPGQELTEEAEKSPKDLVSDAKESGLGEWRQFKVVSPIKEGAHCKPSVDTCRVLTGRRRRKRAWWPGVTLRHSRALAGADGLSGADGEKDLGSKGGNLGIPQRVSRRSSNLKVISVAALRGWRIGSLGDFAQRADSIAMYIYVLRRNGIRRTLAAFGSAGL